jgi:hypothetical protein
LLSDQHVERILQCAASQKLPNVEALVKETHWRRDWAEELGESLLSVVHKHYPPPSLPTPSTETAARPSKGRRGQMKCSKCHETGHNGKRPSLFCTTLLMYSKPPIAHVQRMSRNGNRG